MRGRDEPGLVRGRRQVDAAVQHRVEERRVAPRLLPPGAVVVAHLVLGEEDREQAAGGLHPVRHALLGQRLRDQPGDRRRRGVDAQVDLVGAGPERGQPGRHRDRVPGQRAGLVDGAGRGQPGHHLGPAAERRGRQPAAHHLAEREQVGLDRIQPVPAGGADPEAGHHLVEDEQRTVRGGDAAQLRVEAVQRRDDAHVRRRRLGDHAGDLGAAGRERGLDRGHVVVRQHDRVAGLGTGHARGVGQGEGRDPGAGGGQQRVHVTVVAAGELHHDAAAGRPAGQPDRRHRRLGAAVDQPDLLDRRHPGHDLLGQLDLAGRRACRSWCRAPPRTPPPARRRGGRARGSSAPRSRPGRRTRCRPRRRASGRSRRS